MVKQIFHRQIKTTQAAAILLGITVLGSRILGLVRDRILAGIYGAGDELDIYYASFQIPDFLYSIIIMGAISTAFLPLFAEYFHRDQKEAWKFANELLNFFVFLLLVGGFILLIIAPLLVQVIAPGFSGEKYTTAVEVTRIMLLSPVLFGISNIVGVILQFFRRFLVYSLAPLLYNVGIIFGALFFVPLWGIHGLAYGVILGAFLHMSIQIPVAVSCGFRARPFTSFFSHGVQKVLFLAAPRSFGLMVSHLSLIIFTALASFISSGAIAVFHFANNLQYLPIGIVGISFAVAAFPSLSQFYVQADEKRFWSEFSKIFRAIIFIVVPIAVLFFLLRAHIVRVVLGTGNFGWVDTRLTAAALGAFSLGLVFLSIIPLCTRAFYARHNTKTPVMINTIGTIVSILFAFVLFLWMRQGGLFPEILFEWFDLKGVEGREMLSIPIGIAFGAGFNFIFLFYALLYRQPDYRMSLLNSVGIISAIALLSGFIGYALLYLSASWFDQSKFFGILSHGALAGLASIGVYGLGAWIAKIPEYSFMLQKLMEVARNGRSGYSLAKDQKSSGTDESI